MAANAAGWTLKMSKDFFAAPISTTYVVLAAAAGLSVVASTLNQLNFKPVESMTAEFKSKENIIAHRSDAPAVFLNPIYNYIPGNIRGPDDLERN